MSKQYPGGIISKTPVTPSGPYETSTASGIWTLDQQAYWRKLNQWPIAGSPAPDPQFNYVTMLLHGDGTNGAQNNTFLDSSTNNFTITRNGNTTQGSFSPYGSGWSNYFDGNGDYLTAANNTALDVGTGAFTIEGWIYRDGTGDTDWRIVAGSVSNAGFFGGRGTLSLGFGRAAVAWDLESASNVYSLNTWTHVVYVRNGSGNLAIFANGTRVATTTNSNNYGLNGGLIEVGAEGANQYFGGYISNVRVVKGTAVYDPTASTLTVPTTPLTAVSGTGLLTCADNRFIDDSANNFTITRNGNTSVQRFNPFGTSTAYSTSVIGGSGYFDGTGDYLTSSCGSVGTGDFTIEGWFYFRTTPSTMGLFQASSTSGGFAPNQTANLAVATGSSSTWQIYAKNTFTTSSSTSVPVNAWGHMALVRSGTTTVLYINGAVVITLTSDSTNYSTSFIGLGGIYDNSSYLLNGYLSNFRVVVGTAVYTAAFTPPTAQLTAISGTALLTNFTNGAIFDNAMINNLETVGNAQISTSVVKYGTGSIALDGTGDYMTFVPGANCALGTGDFTVEGWFYVTNNLTDIYFFDTRNAGQTSNCWGCGYGQGGTSGRLAFFIGTGFVQTSGSVGSLNTWMHIAFVRASGTLTIYLNGTSVASGSLTDNASTISTLGYIGTRYTQTFDYGGYIDELRLTKGYARYTANFTPPTAAFPNTGPY